MVVPHLIYFFSDCINHYSFHPVFVYNLLLPHYKSSLPLSTPNFYSMASPSSLPASKSIPSSLQGPTPHSSCTHLLSSTHLFSTKPLNSHPTTITINPPPDSLVPHLLCTPPPSTQPPHPLHSPVFN